MYKPNQRLVEVEMLAQAGWVTGTIHVPERSALLAFLNKDAAFMPVTTAGEGGEFLAVRRKAVVMLIPEPGDVDDHPCVQPGVLESCRIRCLFDGASVEGTIQVLSGQRMSDYLESNPGFFLLSECTLAFEDGRVQSEVAHVVVSSEHLLAVTDLTKRARGHIVLELTAVGAR
jgi:hypothetical protein